MRASPTEPQNDLDLSTLPAVLRKSAGRLAMAAALVGLVTYGVTLLVPPRFSSEAQIRIGETSPGDGARGGVGSVEAAALRVDREAIASRVQELRSPDLARKLAAELRLSTRPEFNSALDGGGLVGSLMRIAGLGAPRPGETEEERVLAAYYRALQVYQVKDTRVITLGFTARDGDTAARAANRLIELYQEWIRQQGVAETVDASAWLVPEIEKRTGELAAAEAEVERFRATANLFRGGGSQPSGLAEQQLADLASELTRVRAQRGEAEARAQAARELMTRGVPDSIPDVQRSPLIQGLIAQRVRAERDLAEASAQLLPAHPRMKQLNANVADIRRQVQREASTIVDGLTREVKALALREELQSRTLEEAKARLGDKAGDRVRLGQLEGEAKAKRRELEALRERYEASRTRGTGKAVPVEVQVIATAQPSSRPSSPNREQIAGLAAAATFVLGLVLILFRELLRGGSRQGGKTGSASGWSHATAPATGVGQRAASASVAAPHARTVTAQEAAAPDPSAAGTARRARRLSPVGEVVQRLIGNAAGQSGYRTLVAGADDGVDAREIAVDIAAGLSEAGRRVVLVDASRDGAGLAQLVGVAASPGFAELIAGSASFEDVIRTLADGDIHIVPCGALEGKGVADVEPNRLNLLLDALDEAYGDVVITGTHSASRELFLAIEGRVDAGVLVASPGSAVPEAESTQRFLGFDVSDIDVIRLTMRRVAPGAPSRLARRSGRQVAAHSATAAAG